MRVAMGTVFASLLPGVAVAQAPDAGGKMCVHETLAGLPGRDVIARVVLREDVTDEQIAEAGLFVKDATAACVSQHRAWTESQTASASELGMYGVTMDYLSARLMEKQATKDAVAGIGQVWSGLSEADLDLLLQDNWRSNLAFEQRLKAGLVAGGIPEDDLAVELSFRSLEMMTLAAESRGLFDLGAGKS
jgi:hypothetical protein